MTADALPYAILFVLALFLVILLVLRERLAKGVTGFDIAYALTTGRRETQADACLVSASKSGYLMAVSDGMGAEYRGTKVSEIVCGILEEQYSYYGNESRMNAGLFFGNALSLADRRIKNYLAGERGGASLCAAVVIGDHLLCAYSGNARLAVLRKGCLVSLYEGHTVRELAQKTYLAGGIDQEAAIAYTGDRRVYSCLGCDSFESEICAPVQLQKGDRIILMTDGVFFTLGWQRITEILSGKGSATALAQRIISACEAASCDDNAATVVAKV
jgi:serine/threonine protein phosphatase PrpC